MYTNSSGGHRREMRSYARNCLYHYAEDVTTGWDEIQELLSQMDSPFTDGMTTPPLSNEPEWQEDYWGWIGE